MSFQGSSYRLLGVLDTEPKPAPRYVEPRETRERDRSLRGKDRRIARKAIQRLKRAGVLGEDF